MQKEIWKPVYLKEFKHKYEISDQGNIRNRITKKPYKANKSKNKRYNTITLQNGTFRKNMRIQRLVYNSFYPTENFHKFHVHHRNSNSFDNRLLNLQILTPQEHYNLEYRQGKIKIGLIGKKNLTYKGPIGQFNKKGILLNVFIGCVDLELSGFHNNLVYRCILNPSNTHKNCYWRRFPKKFKTEIGNRYNLNDPMFLKTARKKAYKKKPREKQLVFDTILF
jgi:hypothetical protein